MPSTRSLIVLIASGLLVACSNADSDPTGPGVLVRDVRLPVAGAAYVGSSTHLFAGGDARMFCGSHGTFSGGVEPPQAVGTTVVSNYTATFIGELTVQPPLATATATYALDVQAQMGESITLATVNGDQRVFDTELIAFELSSGMPTDIVVRRSQTVPSTGVTTITTDRDGLSRVESYYDVWLEISVDAGRSWTPADAAVRMTLESS